MDEKDLIYDWNLIQNDFTRDENGSIDKYGIRKDGRWYACGQRYGATRLTEGWAAFYDYNY